MSFEKLDQLAEKERERQSKLSHRIHCCTSTACLSSGARETMDAFNASWETSEEAEQKVEVVQTGCTGLCSHGPLVRIDGDGGEQTLYGEVTPDSAEKIFNFHTQADSTVDDDLSGLRIPTDLAFFTKQTKVVLRHVGHIDPESLDDYLAHGGYATLYRILNEMSPQEVCDQILESGLRGRGGAGFPTGIKWNFVREQDSFPKYVVVNGDEGDPGAYMDRTVMEANPHQLLEGLLIAAYAVGASQGYFYIRAEYPIAVDRIRRAIRDARRRKLLGRSVLGSDFEFAADVRIGAGAFVCGEETALIHSIEGKRGVPRMRPPYPSTSGLWGQPTVINNVETIANVPVILEKGADWFANIGTEKSKGTKVFALTGELRNTGLIEVPMGITLREIVEDIGQGVPGEREFKAAQTGGPSGGCIPAEHLDTPVDYENLQRLGSIMGSGGLVMIDSATSMPQFARFFIDFCVDESCGKCVPCRVGTVQIREILDKILAGDGTLEDLDRLESLCGTVKTASLCGLGQSAPNPVLSTLRFFRHEYEALINHENETEAVTAS
ncbi:MAG: NuoF family protein [Anaerolineales bacterium]